ncbi:tyrosine--tRNA ligase [Candidatus Micrarchaeota archaeon]|nr:tyrosine--tRNA ligase [Candidatus Micrarchaeota archaeon]
MDIETKLHFVNKPPTQEIVVQEELKSLLETNPHPRHYIGFEISGKLHLGSLLINGFKINDLGSAGFKTQVFLADWHSVINNKLEGNWEKIKTASKYYEEAFKFFCPDAKIVRGSELYAGNDEYWKDVILFSKNMTLARATRCLTILGRSEKDSLELAQYFYPSMQAIDIKHLEADLAHAGMDQRKIHMIAREVFPKLGLKKPLALHHHLIPGLTEPPKIANVSNSANTPSKEDEVAASKMSKSQPSSAIFIHDTEQEIKDKMKKAYCPETIEGNPVLEIAKYLIFHEKNRFTIERDGKFGGNLEFSSYQELENAFKEKKLHPMDLKSGVAKELNLIISPIRRHFENKSELLEVFNETKITR